MSSATRSGKRYRSDTPHVKIPKKRKGSILGLVDLSFRGPLAPDAVETSNTLDVKSISNPTGPFGGLRSHSSKRSSHEEPNGLEVKPQNVKSRDVKTTEVKTNTSAVDSTVEPPPICVSCLKPALKIGFIDRQLRPSFYSSDVKKDSKEDTPRDRYYCTECCMICRGCKRYDEQKGGQCPTEGGQCPTCMREFCCVCSFQVTREEGVGCYYCLPSRRDNRWKKIKKGGQSVRWSMRGNRPKNYPEYRERYSSRTGELQVHTESIVPTRFDGSDSDSNESNSDSGDEDDDSDDDNDE